MVGAFIGDLAAWTWVNERDKFYLRLVSDVAQKSTLSNLMLFTAKTIIDNPGITRVEFIRMHQCHFGQGNAKINAEYDLLRAIIIGWLFDGKYKVA